MGDCTVSQSMLAVALLWRCIFLCLRPATGNSSWAAWPGGTKGRAAPAGITSHPEQPSRAQGPSLPYPMGRSCFVTLRPHPGRKGQPGFACPYGGTAYFASHRSLSSSLLRTGDIVTSPPKDIPHLRPHPGHREPSCLVPAGENPLKPHYVLSDPHPGLLSLTPLWKTRTACPINPLFGYIPLQTSLLAFKTPLSHRGPPHLDPKGGIPPKFPHCPSKLIKVTHNPPRLIHTQRCHLNVLWSQRTFCTVPVVRILWKIPAFWLGNLCLAFSLWWRPCLNATMIAEGSFALSSWWGPHGKPCPHYRDCPIKVPVGSPFHALTLVTEDLLVPSCGAPTLCPLQVTLLLRTQQCHGLGAPHEPPPLPFLPPPQ